MASKPPKYFRVSPKLWHESWDSDQRYLALYLLTTEHRTTEGLFRLPMAYAQSDLGWTKKRTQKAWDALCEADFIRTKDDVVLIVQALKYQSPGNPNQVTGAINALREVPATELDTHFYFFAQAFAQPFAQGLHEQLPERFPHPPNSVLRTPSSSSVDGPHTPAKRGPRANGTNPRANGTNPRAKASQEEAEKQRQAIRDCDAPSCEHNPDGWASLCTACAHRVRKIKELTSA